MRLMKRPILRESRFLFAILYKRFYSAQEDYLKSSLADVNIPNTNFIEFAMKDFHLFPNHIATECAFTGRKYTFNELERKSMNLSKALIKHLRLERKDAVAVLLPNVPEYPICNYGLPMAGLRMTTINPSYTADEIRRQLNDANVKAIITLNEHYNTVMKTFEMMKKRIPVIIIKTMVAESIPENTIDFHELTNVTVDIPNITPLQNDDTVFLPYSSGTTGLPKGVMLTGNNLIACICLMSAPDIKFFNNTSEADQDILPLVLPMYHIYGFAVCTVLLLQSGVKLVTLPKFSSKSFIDCIVKHRSTMLSLVPPLVIFLHSHEDVKKEHFENLRTVICGAAPLAKMDEEKLREKVGHPIKFLQGFGMTETTSIVLATPGSKEGKFTASSGCLLPNTLVKLIKPDDPELKHLGPNTIGEILVKGPQIMKGYYNKPEEDKNTFVDGWFRTGDLAYYNEEQFFYVVDRIKELIKVKGLQVAPAELEEVIRTYAGVSEAGVIGIPHKFSGEVPRAYIVPKSGCKINSKEIEEYVRGKVAPHKRLDGGVVVVESIPKSASGKILRRQLKLLYEEEIKNMRNK